MPSTTFFESIRDGLVAYVASAHAAVVEHCGQVERFEVSWENQCNEILAPLTDLGWRATLSRPASDADRAKLGEGVSGHDTTVYRSWGGNIPVPNPLTDELAALKPQAPRGFFLDSAKRNAAASVYTLAMLRENLGDTARQSEFDAWLEHLVAEAVDAARRALATSGALGCPFTMEGHDSCGPSKVHLTARTIAERRRQHGYTPSDAFLRSFLALYCPDQPLIDAWLEEASGALARVVLPPPKRPTPRPDKGKAKPRSPPKPVPELTHAALVAELTARVPRLSEMALEHDTRPGAKDAVALARLVVAATFERVAPPWRGVAHALATHVPAPFDADVEVWLDRRGHLVAMTYRTPTNVIECRP